jgi:hypothetical protein
MSTKATKTILRPVIRRPRPQPSAIRRDLAFLAECWGMRKEDQSVTAPSATPAVSRWFGSKAA